MPHNRAGLLHNGAHMTTAILATADSAVCDHFAIENGVEVQTLMDRAGRAVANAIRARWAPVPVLVLAGPGNNGGDGLVAARVLREAGWPVRVMLLAAREGLSTDAARALDGWGGPVESPASGFLGDAALVIDALFGAGLSRPVEGSAADWLVRIRDSGLPVVSVDLPSGINGDARPLAGPHLPADLTITFHCRKLAHLVEPFAEMCGETVCVDIGIPDGWEARVTPVAREVDNPDWKPVEPSGYLSLHKHARGRVAVFSGGSQSSGAGRLAAAGALRAGAGVVTLCTPPSASLVNAAHLTAIMLARWGSDDQIGEVLTGLRAEAAVLGPALGVGPATRKAVLGALVADVPLVLDADALTSFADDADSLVDQLHDRCVLTPHHGEFSRLFGEGRPNWNKLEQAQAAAERCGCTVLLKGPATIIATPGLTPWINRHACRWLATAGSGDVLAGIIAAGLAAGMSPHDAAAGATWLHGDAALRQGAGMTAEDLPDALSGALQALQQRRRQTAALSHLLSHGS